MPRELLSSDSSDSEDGGADIASNAGLKVNEEYARRFEHNKKREELARLEEKHGKPDTSRKRKRDEASDSDESTSESEDEGEFATEALDSQIIATINAIRSKDPRVYDDSTTFYTERDDRSEAQSKAKEEKPMRLQDYHRQNLLRGSAIQEEDDAVPLTYNQEQEQLKRSILGEINAAAAEPDSEDEEDEISKDQFLVAKPKQKMVKTRETVPDVEIADKDPETFLSNFMASRAWAASDAAPLHPFESDDDEEERRAEEFEEAYNLRFEDPEKSNEKLRSHARDLAAKYSVRREETNPRQKKREAEKARKEDERQQRKEEKARLRKLKIEELEEKVRRIKRAAGIRTQDIQPEDWSHFVDEDWDDAKWENEMQKRFGDDYYAEQDVESSSDEETKKRKPRKPKFEDDIDIKDIIPDFQDEEKAEFSLTDEEQPAKKRKKSKKSYADEKRDAKKERRIIEQLVDDQLQMELDASIPGNKKAASFRYRETSPKSFGLSARDILLAEDKALNEFVGLKKLASFRDPEKKRKDAKNLGKKARLRKWRMETFGNEEGLQASNLIPAQPDIAEDQAEDDDGGVDIGTEGKKKKKRRRSKKSKMEAETVS
ncbi:Kinetochore protein Spc24 [Cladophialophora chaetospira]|uniref:Kinetochore protein Spc24 n=1 Tax=Cladophialophora chaetospira TaxID=386627 RepID=A0AA39CH17_9EURO|nr:Kinetochore protein Spc24 [Cladophialophora chaetospira]